MRSRAVHRFAYRGWQVAVSLDGLDAKGEITAHADVELDGSSQSRRIVIDEPCRDCGAALRRLAQGARSFVDQCQASMSKPESTRAAQP